jgi:uncharacterized protein YjbI with pentapeptide repeats
MLTCPFPSLKWCSGAILVRRKFGGANLVRRKFGGASLVRRKFGGASFGGASWGGANLAAQVWGNRQEWAFHNCGCLDFRFEKSLNTSLFINNLNLSMILHQNESATALQ